MVHTASHRYHGNIGEHGSLGTVQRRAPFIAAGPGVRADGWIERRGPHRRRRPHRRRPGRRRAPNRAGPVRRGPRRRAPGPPGRRPSSTLVVDPADGHGRPRAARAVGRLQRQRAPGGHRRRRGARTPPGSSTGARHSTAASWRRTRRRRWPTTPPSAPARCPATRGSSTTSGAAASPASIATCSTSARCSTPATTSPTASRRCTRPSSAPSPMHGPDRRTSSATGAPTSRASVRWLGRERLPFARSDDEFPRDGHWWEQLSPLQPDDPGRRDRPALCARLLGRRPSRPPLRVLQLRAHRRGRARGRPALRRGAERRSATATSGWAGCSAPSSGGACSTTPRWSWWPTTACSARRDTSPATSPRPLGRPRPRCRRPDVPLRRLTPTSVEVDLEEFGLGVEAVGRPDLIETVGAPRPTRGARRSGR